MERGERYIPWREAKLWRCIRCGECCRAYIAPLKINEAASLTRKYGPVVVYYNGKYYLSKKGDGSCIFLTKVNGIAYCTIYLERPLSCKLYPFHLSMKPMEGVSEENARIEFEDMELYLYLDSLCPGIGHGYRIEDFIPKIVDLWRIYSSTR
jgi:Fe-S-cluster containining protein